MFRKALFQFFMLLTVPVTLSEANAEEKKCQEVASRPELICPLKVGSTLPDVSLRDADDRRISLQEITKSKPSVIVFYRGGWCPYCNKQLHQLQDSLQRLNQLGFQILAISPDQPLKLKGTVKSQYLSYALLSDSKMDAAKAFGIAFQLDETEFKKMVAMGIPLEENSKQNHHQLPVPSVFICDASRTIQFVYSNPDFTIRLSGEELVAATKKLGTSPLLH